MKYDKELLNSFEAIIGCDEVGRGPIAGPVTGGAVKIKKEDEAIFENLLKLNVTDSKKLSSKKRQGILNDLGIDVSQIELGRVYNNTEMGQTFSFCLFEHTPLEVDEMDILQASLSAMKNASELLLENDVKIFVDGNKTFPSTQEIEAVVKGDSKLVIIGLASIIAKEFRDEKMKNYDSKYPGYNFSKHAGYPTKEHRDAVRELGPCDIHRKSFKGVKEFI